MSQILKAVIMAAYSTLLFHFLQTLHRNEQDIQISYIARQSIRSRMVMREIRKSESLSTYVDTNFTRPLKLHTDLKYVLKWSTAYSSFNTLNMLSVSGQQPFIDNNCTLINCFLTSLGSLLLHVGHFDAILFDAETEYHPVPRAAYQKYIFTATEPSSENRVCHPAFDSFYNWTWTYKLDSTMVQPFFSIYHKNGTLAGPKKDMQWIKSRTVSERILERLMYKHKMVAWFVSKCRTQSGREKVAEGLARALKLYNFTVDIYGWCGKRVCPKNSVGSCFKMLETDYYFYLAFEKAKCKDYVSEKVLHALNHYTVPIVFGGANYSRFLPPGSYIDATTMDSHSLARLMIETIEDKKVYGNYFRWHEHYYYKQNKKGLDVCQLCRSLNEPAQAHAWVNNFTTWWNTGVDAC